VTATPYSDLLASIQKRAINNRLFARRQISTVVIVEGVSHPLSLRSVPLVGTLLDVGQPVSVTSSKRVAGGGAIVYAKRINSGTPSSA
jgi:hypothetical protein